MIATNFQRLRVLLTQSLICNVDEFTKTVFDEGFDILSDGSGWLVG